MAALAQFFDPSQPPPAAAEPPTDAGLATRVAKLVEFASRNGPSFVALIQGKQKASLQPPTCTWNWLVCITGALLQHCTVERQDHSGRQIASPTDAAGQPGVRLPV